MALSQAACERLLKHAESTIQTGKPKRSILVRDQKSFVSGWFAMELHAVFARAVCSMANEKRHTVLKRDVPNGYELLDSLKAFGVPRASVYSLLKRYSAQTSQALGEILGGSVSHAIRLSSDVVNPILLLAIEGTLKKIQLHMEDVVGSVQDTGASETVLTPSIEPVVASKSTSKRSARSKSALIRKHRKFDCRELEPEPAPQVGFESDCLPFSEDDVSATVDDENDSHGLSPPILKLKRTHTHAQLVNYPSDDEHF